MPDARRHILISGAGIAGLTCAALLGSRGWHVIVVERAPRPAHEGYMMDFFGLGWEVAERMGLLSEIASYHYPIESLAFVGPRGHTYASARLERIRFALGGRYTFLRRSDLGEVLIRAAQDAGAEIRFGCTLEGLSEVTGGVIAALSDGSQHNVDCVVGADGVHSQTRALLFSNSASFLHSIDIGVVAFHTPLRSDVGNRAVVYEERGRTAMFYPVDASSMDAMFLAPLGRRTTDLRNRAREFLECAFEDAGWICSNVITHLPHQGPVYSDVLYQVRMPAWCRGRVVLIGDACGAPTPIAAQGAHLAMAGAWLLAKGLGRTPDDPPLAFRRYEASLRSHVAHVQARAEQMARMWIPSATSRLWLRRLVVGLAFRGPLLNLVLREFRAPPLDGLESASDLAAAS